MRHSYYVKVRFSLLAKVFSFVLDGIAKGNSDGLIQIFTSGYDDLIEREFHPRDKLKPTTSIVIGSHFVFAKPLLFRRNIE